MLLIYVVSCDLLPHGNRQESCVLMIVVEGSSEEKLDKSAVELLMEITCGTQPQLHS